ncbi:hypothetical protein [Acidiplasma aeolicum]|jgi:hypothetical protein|uniref:hypothetical protein n=2 Tax=Acidiplasma TaxID=507753 RepID=UPI0037208FD4
MYGNEIYIVPVGSQIAIDNMNRTLINSIDVSVIHSMGINIAFNGNRVNLWGFTPGASNRKQWSNFTAGDYVLFIPTHGMIIVTEITEKMESDKLARYIWGTDENGNTWSLIFFVNVIAKVIKDKREFLTELGYSDKDNLLGNRRVTEKFHKIYSSVNDFIDSNSYKNGNINYKELTIAYLKFNFFEYKAGKTYKDIEKNLMAMKTLNYTNKYKISNNLILMDYNNKFY